MLGVIASWVFIAASQLPAPSGAAPPRDAGAPARTGTAVIRGRATERGTDVPIVRLEVRLDGAGADYTTLTDDQGRYEFTRLPAGDYRLLANGTRFRQMHVPQPFLERDVSGHNGPVALNEGDVREGLDFVLTRFVVINGRVVDEYGEPLSDIRVVAEPLTRLGGVSTFRSRQTDDRGQFRLFGLAPGRYRLCADPDTSFGDRQTDAFVRTCYPSTSLEEESPPVAVTRGERDDIEIRLLRTRVFTLSGSVVDVTGAPASGASAILTRVGANGGSGSSIPVDAAGAFTARGLPPGNYTLHVEPKRAQRKDDRGPRPVGFVAFTVASDVDLVVPLVWPVKIAGRILFEDGPPPEGVPGLKVRAVAVAEAIGRDGFLPDSGDVRPDLTFEIDGVYASRVIRVEGLPRGYVIKSVRYRNEPILDVPTGFRASPDPQDLQVVLTSRVGRVIARVVDDSGTPLRSGAAIIFPAEPRTWGRPFGVIQQGMRLNDGRISLGPVRAGDYFVLAVAPEEFPYMSSRTTLEAFARRAERITLGENDEQQIELRLRDR